MTMVRPTGFCSGQYRRAVASETMTAESILVERTTRRRDMASNCWSAALPVAAPARPGLASEPWHARPNAPYRNDARARRI